jgi:hypothetical protein
MGTEWIEDRWMMKKEEVEKEEKKTKSNAECAISLIA